MQDIVRTKEVLVRNLLTRFFYYKNELYKKVEAEICRKVKSVLRIFRGSNSNQYRNLSMKLHKIY